MPALPSPLPLRASATASSSSVMTVGRPTGTPLAPQRRPVRPGCALRPCPARTRRKRPVSHGHATEHCGTHHGTPGILCGKKAGSARCRGGVRSYRRVECAFANPQAIPWGTRERRYTGTSRPGVHPRGRYVVADQEPARSRIRGHTGSLRHGRDAAKIPDRSQTGPRPVPCPPTTAAPGERALRGRPESRWPAPPPRQWSGGRHDTPRTPSRTARSRARATRPTLDG